MGILYYIVHHQKGDFYNSIKNKPTEVLEGLKSDMEPKGFRDSLSFCLNEKRVMEYFIISEILEERERESASIENRLLNQN